MLLDFKNQTLDLSDLPKFETVEGHNIDRAFLKIQRISYLSWSIGLILALVVSHYFADFPSLLFYAALAALIILFSLIIIETEKGFPKRKFGIREKDIIFQKGYFIFKQTIVPYKCIQHVELKQGLIFRFFGLYSLKLYTAGSSSGDLHIAGLNKTDADKLKAIILKVASLDEN